MANTIMYIRLIYINVYRVNRLLNIDQECNSYIPEDPSLKSPYLMLINIKEKQTQVLGLTNKSVRRNN